MAARTPAARIRHTHTHTHTHTTTTRPHPNPNADDARTSRGRHALPAAPVSPLTTRFL